MRSGRTQVTVLVSLLAAVMIAWMVGPAIQHSAAQEQVAVAKFDPSRDAARDLRDAISEAGRTGKRVLVDVGGEWCVWCRRLDSLFAGNRALNEFRAAHYVTIKVNWSKENKNEAVLSRFPKVAGYPHLFVLESDGSLLHSQDTGELEKGKGHDPAQVMVFLQKWAARKGTP
ncbi:MAG: thioredoxin family protein [Bacteroidota bacterium]